MIAYKVKAYTILELIVTMMIAVIVIGITYYAYSIVSKSYLSFNEKNNKMADLVKLDELLRKDLSNCYAVFKDQDGITMNYRDHNIKYQFLSEAIIRTGFRVDTFRVKSDEVITSFEGKPVSDVYLFKEQNRVDELNYNLLFQGEKIPYRYYKQYSSEDLINKNQLTVE